MKHLTMQNKRKEVNFYFTFFYFKEKVPPWAPNKLLSFLRLGSGVITQKQNWPKFANDYLLSEEELFQQQNISRTFHFLHTAFHWAFLLSAFLLSFNGRRTTDQMMGIRFVTPWQLFPFHMLCKENYCIFVWKLHIFAPISTNMKCVLT